VVSVQPLLVLPLERDPVSIVQVAGWTLGLVWTGAESPPPLLSELLTAQPVQRDTDYVVLAHTLIVGSSNIAC
jgi:hypothetical protein